MSLTLTSLSLYLPATCTFAYVVHAPVESSNSALSRSRTHHTDIATLPCYVYIVLYSDLLPSAIPNLYGGGDGSHFNPYRIVP